MASDLRSASSTPFWMKHAEDATIHNEGEKDAAADQAIVQFQVQVQSDKSSLGSTEKEEKGDALKKFVQVSNMSPRLTAVQLRQIFSTYGTVVDCFITNSKNLVYIEYLKPEEARRAALLVNKMLTYGRLLNVEIAKSLPQKPSSYDSSSSLPMMMPQQLELQK